MSAPSWFSGEGSVYAFLVAILAAWVALVLLWAVLRSIVMLVRYGPRAYMRSALAMDATSWRLIAALILVVVAVLFAFGWPSGLTPLDP